MSKAVNNLKLGVFVIAGLLFLVLLLYMIGKNQSMFGSNFILKARFENVQGLRAGNNVRFAGIDVGTVKEVNILSDTVVEVIMYIDNDIKKHIRKNAIASIGTDGVMGNKLVNIIPVKRPEVFVASGDVLAGRKAVDMDEMLRTLQRTTDEINAIAFGLKNTVERINTSTALWTIINDETLPRDLRATVKSVRQAANKASIAMGDVQGMIANVKEGNGTLGKLVADTAIASGLSETLAKIGTVGDNADTLSRQINSLVKSIEHDVNYGKGPVNAVLKDTAMVNNLANSLINIEKGTENFNQNMEALKHNFLFKRYFKKLEKSQRQAALKN